jgi:hypothetical protein
LPAGFYEASHLFGPGWGTEAGDGIGLAPIQANDDTQAIETHAKSLHADAQQVVDRYGNRGFVQVNVTSASHPTTAWLNPNRRGDYGGYLLLKQAAYNIAVCHPDGQGGFNVVDRQFYSVNVGPPGRGGLPGAVSSTLP